MKTTLWYAQECGRIFSQKFYKGIIETVEAIAAMPSMGILDERRSNLRQNTTLFHRTRSIESFTDMTTRTFMSLVSEL